MVNGLVTGSNWRHWTTSRDNGLSIRSHFPALPVVLVVTLNKPDLSSPVRVVTFTPRPRVPPPLKWCSRTTPLLRRLYPLFFNENLSPWTVKHFNEIYPVKGNQTIMWSRTRTWIKRCDSRWKLVKENYSIEINTVTIYTVS